MGVTEKSRIVPHCAGSCRIMPVRQKKKSHNFPKKLFSKILKMSESTDLISKSSCCEIANETESVAKQIIKQASLWINLCGKIYHLEERDDLVYIVACWAHQPLLNENAFELLAAKSKYISAFSAWINLLAKNIHWIEFLRNEILFWKHVYFSIVFMKNYQGYLWTENICFECLKSQ